MLSAGAAGSLLLLLLTTALANVGGAPTAKVLGSWLRLYNPRSVAISSSGNIACVVDSAAGLKILDISNSSAPSILGSFKTQYQAEDVVILGSLAYVVESDGFRIVQISNPSEPTTLSFLSNISGFKIKIIGQIAYVGSYGALYIVDITNPTQPSLLSTYYRYQLTDFAVSGTTGVVIANEFFILDLSVPRLPVERSAVLFTTTQALAISGTIVYLGSSRALRVVDISNQNLPRIVFSINQICASVLLVSDTYLLASCSASFLIFDISEPALPKPIWQLQDSSITISSFGVRGNTLILAGGHGLWIYALSNIIPTLLGTFPSSNATGVAVSDDTVFLLDSAVGLKIISASNRISPVLIGTIAAQKARSIAVAGKVVYLLDSVCVQIVNVSNPASPQPLGSWGTGLISGSDITVVDSRMYVTDSLQGCLYIVDVSNPSQPAVLGKFGSTPGVTSKVAVMSNIVAFVTGPSRLLSLNVSNPAAPSWMNIFASHSDWAVSVFKSYAFWGEDQKVLIIDSSNIAHPLILAVAESVVQVTSIAATDTKLYMAGGIFGLMIRDISDIRDPKSLYSFPCLNASSVAVSRTSENLAYVVDYNRGLAIVNTTTSSPKSLSYMESSFAVPFTDIVSSGSTVYVLAEDINILDFTAPDSPQLVGKIYYNGNSMVLSGTLVYIVSDYLRIIDTLNPSVMIGLMSLSPPGVSIALSNSIAYIANSINVVIVDVSQPGFLKSLGSFSNIQATGVAVQGNIVYIVGTPGLEIYDTTNIYSPQRLSSLKLASALSSFVSIALTGSTAFIAGDTGLTIVDGSVPTDPIVLLGTWGGFSGQNIAVSNSTVYVTEVSGLTIINASDPTSPQICEQLGLSNGISTAISGNTAYVLDKFVGVFAIDTSACQTGLPILPIRRAQTPTPSPDPSSNTLTVGEIAGIAVAVAVVALVVGIVIGKVHGARIKQRGGYMPVVQEVIN